MRRPQQHKRILGYGPGKKIKRERVINRGIVYYPSMKKIQVKKVYQVMRPSDAEELPKNSFYEVKMDGSRGNLYLDKKYGAAFINRRGVNCTESYPELHNAYKNLRADQAVVDGEVVAVTKDRPLGDFKSLAQREHVEDGGEILSRSKSTPLKYFAFDILEKDGRDLTSLPLSERRKILDKVVPDNHEDIKEIPYFTDFRALQKFIKGKDAEGFVAKDMDSKYEEGGKTKSWQKKKILMENDVAVIGFTEGTGKRKGKIGALLVGVYDKSSGKYEVKSKVGTGFSDEELDSLTKKLKPLVTDKDYIKGKVPASFKYKFVKPELVARINFLRETDKGGYREPRFISLRSDIPSTETHKAIKPLKNFGSLITVQKHTTIGTKPVQTLPSKQVIKLAREIKKSIKPNVKRAEIAGSIRRKKKEGISDIDIVVIPKDKEKLKIRMRKKGPIIQEGDHKVAYNVKGVKTEIYFAKPKDWGAQLLFATGSGGHNIGLRRLAKMDGMKLNQYGLWKGDKLIASRTEKDIYKKLHRPKFTKPEERI